MQTPATLQQLIQEPVHTNVGFMGGFMDTKHSRPLSILAQQSHLLKVNTGYSCAIAAAMSVPSLPVRYSGTCCSPSCFNAAL